jgi:ASC-1-like (ASCH) protein
LITVLQEFYTPDSQQKYGVLGIEIQKIWKHPCLGIKSHPF